MAGVIMWSGKRISVSLAVALAMLAACRQSDLRRELFIIDVAEMPRPVMVSRPPRPVGRPVHRLEAVTGTRHSLLVTPDTTTEHTVRALVSAADVLKAEIQPDDRWIQIEGVEFHALDVNGFGFARTDRTLTITGTAHQ